MMHTPKERTLSWLTLLGWMAVIFLLSSEGHDISSGRSDTFVHALQSIGITWQTDLLTFLVRKSAHITAYFILGILAYNVVRLHQQAIQWRIITSISIVALYAISDEFHQLFVPGRSGEVRDVLIDSIAGICGIVIAHYLYSRHTLNKSRK